ncbi:NAD(P)-dependent glycerol-3-phosphate dehydrogenase [Oleomonas cavernae]|uniref:Glycerol-3-phosphate dehydrogenase [NAD(P)+] n=1 Tax=Oleomonas cavernae TaxID=2320859 RepID=A0A418WCL1_9PROT|nr:NAD(P)H-dependent glycerol-3-phosphate dehydrogenase [Oleomonas cavernae]RJF87716.1 NAD(P)-dependent glycerol-3-phosphate dehydrogenase [Oleomonas cavernae]
MSTRASDDHSPAAFGRIAIIGAGAWGTALALAALRAGRQVVLWAREAAVLESVARDRTNPFMAGITLPPAVAVTGALEQALAGADLVLLTTPSQHLRAMAGQCEGLLAPGVPVVICAKGVEAETGLLMSEVVAAAMPGRPQAVLSGPTFAAEVARDLPTAVTVAAAGGTFDSSHLAARVAVTFATTRFRPYLADDVIGVEIGGAVKNVIAIACGIAQGRALGSNARATLITRGLAELTRLAVALGARADTLSGLAGVGDLVLTCSSEQSRNFSYGKALGEGRNPRLDEGGPVVEGAVNAASVVALAGRLGIDMPICEAVDSVLRGASLDRVMMGLMTSGLRPEPLAAEDQVRIPHPASRED